MYDVQKIRKDFPILGREVYGRPLVYLDNAATTQKPLCVLDAMRDEYLNVNANVHRGVHYLSQQATDLHEAARESVRQFINAQKTEEIVFTRGTTEAINLVATAFCESQMQMGDEVLVTEMEHHSNIVPWQLQAMKRGIAVRHLPMTNDGRLIFCDDIATYLTERTKLVSVTHVSNVLGTINPVADIIRIAHERGIPVLVDAAQSAPHMKIDVQTLDCDFLAFSGHKMYGPTGIGVLYGKEVWLEKLPPYQGGGEMIDKVTWERTTFERLPFKFEAGTPDYVASHGLATAIRYMEAIGLDDIEAHEKALTQYALAQLQTIDGLVVYGPQENRDAVVSFNVGTIHHLDIGTLLDRLGIAVRTGHHCAQPLIDRLDISGTVRASFALYNTCEEIDTLVSGLRRVIQMF
jgi:cysteine desulfurase (EC 2.8.1.7)/L-selenocysteine selenide-lyase (L-alanine-forming) (EC 4.4.1.16)